ncbi:hypothetical protein STCU_05085 [Strigomonas culicis]|nr:hypothetical protein STCU_05085 [Strigomonas culicis]|eukprot:EPY28495.1 hypothetical protein STCU_05085 [Strigomonas culicis]
MVQSGPNFSLLIETEKRDEHVLIESGCYAVLRHPAYFGWFWRTFCSQLIVANPLCFLFHTTATWLFFKDRIPYEESLLVSDDFFGEKYEAYRRGTPVGIPFIS